jgi:hypothetical protein
VCLAFWVLRRQEVKTLALIFWTVKKVVRVIYDNAWTGERREATVEEVLEAKHPRSRRKHQDGRFYDGRGNAYAQIKICELDDENIEGKSICLGRVFYAHVGREAAEAEINLLSSAEDEKADDNVDFHAGKNVVVMLVNEQTGECREATAEEVFEATPRNFVPDWSGIEFDRIVVCELDPDGEIVRHLASLGIIYE